MGTVTRDVRFVKWFEELGIEDVPSVGGKNASLGEMYRELASQGIRVPNGFAVTAAAYRLFVQEAGLDRQFKDTLADLDVRKLANLSQRGREVRQAILAAPLPGAVERAILEAYDRLNGEGGKHLDVAVRSSATAEDLPDASFAGQQETYLNVQGHRCCWRPAGAVSPRCSPIAPLRIAWRKALTISKSRSPSECSGWSARTWPPPG